MVLQNKASRARVAQWIARQTSNLEVVGSSPISSAIFNLDGYISFVVISLYVAQSFI